MLLAELADAAGDAEFGQERGEKEGGRGIDSREQKRLSFHEKAAGRVVSGMKKIKVRGR